MKKVTVEAIRRAYEKIDRSVYPVGSTNWCSVMAAAINVELSSEEVREPSILGRGVQKLASAKVVSGYTGDPEEGRTVSNGPNPHTTWAK